MTLKGISSSLGMGVVLTVILAVTPIWISLCVVTGFVVAVAIIIIGCLLDPDDDDPIFAPIVGFLRHVEDRWHEWRRWRRKDRFMPPDEVTARLREL